MSTQQLFADDSNERSIIIEKYRAEDEPAIVADPVSNDKWSLLIDMTAIVVEAPEFNDDGEPMYGPDGKNEMSRSEEHYIFKDDVDREITSILEEYGRQVINYRARKVYQIENKQDIKQAVDEIEPLVTDGDNWKVRDSISGRPEERGRDVDDSW